MSQEIIPAKSTENTVNLSGTDILSKTTGKVLGTRYKISDGRTFAEIRAALRKTEPDLKGRALSERVEKLMAETPKAVQRLRIHAVAELALAQGDCSAIDYRDRKNGHSLTIPFLKPGAPAPSAKEAELEEKHAAALKAQEDEHKKQLASLEEASAKQAAQLEELKAALAALTPKKKK